MTLFVIPGKISNIVGKRQCEYSISEEQLNFEIGSSCANTNNDEGEDLIQNDETMDDVSIFPMKF